MQATKRVRPLVVLCVLLAAALVVATVLAIYFGVRKTDSGGGGGGGGGSGGKEVPPPSESVQGAYWQAAVTTNGRPCAPIGADILQRGGSAVEAAVAALFCEGVASPQSMGLGGGFVMTVYTRATRTAITLNARETAPAAAHRDMYGGNATLMQFGGLASAVPGELLGLWEAAERFKSGNISWSDLVMPTVRVCEEGFTVTAYLERAIKNAEASIRISPTLSDILVKGDGTLRKEGDIMRRPQLAQTLRIIAEEGASAFYGGDVGRRFVEDVRALGGILTEDDLTNYTVKWEDPVSAQLSDGHTLHTVQLPGSGPLLAFMLNILDGAVPAARDAVTWQRIVEAFKFAYGRRTELGDPDYVPEIAELLKNLTSRSYAAGVRESIRDDLTFNDPGHYGSVLMQPDNHGTAHISVLAPNGDAVAVTSTINLLFGAKVRSRSTGIILNDEMDDFSAPNITNAYGVPPSPNNFIEPGKRPLSSMCPAIVVDANGDVRLVTGGAGGTKITTATALAIIDNLWFSKTAKESVDARRIHHQLFPMAIQYEEGFDKEVILSLESFGHKVEQYAVGSSFISTIAVNHSAPYQQVFANSDFRRLGVVAGF